MDYQLIMLEQPIVVSNEPVRDHDPSIDFNRLLIIPKTERGFGREGLKKVIAGIDGLPSIDFSGLSAEDHKTLGIIDLNSSIKTYLKYELKKDDEYILKNPQRVRDFQKGMDTVLLFMNKRYSEEQLRIAITAAWTLGQRVGNNLTDQIDAIMNSLSQTKIYDVKIETEENIGNDSNFMMFVHKITNNSIKILEICRN